MGFDRIEAGTLHVDVAYEIVGSNDPRNLVFPFYVIPDQDVTGPANAPAELEV